eukprot:CAMPEP_0206141598 /NCGR_PEP_ID=MMETSP1473-20131121/13517_1 /ASSEMBLY_ACC=CAM_ASM_001109 /TAXON_ID=1461547 /ORGANISM="Stichococcus sp, Strain RCC1054" /LENGTH=40 /DNA_ID= /DNA_START= /DNA_END= /DNA_ORIENTATION=
MPRSDARSTEPLLMVPWRAPEDLRCCSSGAAKALGTATRL